MNYILRVNFDSVASRFKNACFILLPLKYFFTHAQFGVYRSNIRTMGSWDDLPADIKALIYYHLRWSVPDGMFHPLQDYMLVNHEWWHGMASYQYCKKHLAETVIRHTMCEKTFEHFNKFYPPHLTKLLYSADKDVELLDPINLPELKELEIVLRCLTMRVKMPKLKKLIVKSEGEELDEIDEDKRQFLFQGIKNGCQVKEFACDSSVVFTLAKPLLVSLTELRLDFDISEEDIRILELCQDLKKLSVCGLSLTPNVPINDELAAVLKKIESVTFNVKKGSINDEEMVLAFISHMPNLTSLTIHQSHGFPDLLFPCVAGICTKLVKFHYIASEADETLIHTFNDYNLGEQLEELVIEDENSGPMRWNFDAIDLSSYPNLTTLKLDGDLETNGLQRVGLQCRKLQNLETQYVEIDQEELLHSNNSELILFPHAVSLAVMAEAKSTTLCFDTFFKQHFPNYQVDKFMDSASMTVFCKHCEGSNNHNPVLEY